ncbi:COP9 signalosome complex subunit 8 [Halotydeus destructor]|nr:COP9 signalosome complex subunit 8 [Halotydeus destructor]
MDLKPDYAAVASNLEARELESGGDCSPQLFGQLLAIYLLNNDSANAKLLWKRIPANYKSETPELNAIWNIGKLLIQCKWSDAYVPLAAYEWPGYVKNIMASLLERLKEQAVSLIAESYSHIRFEEFQKLVGISSEEEAHQLIEKLGWSRTGSGHVLTKRIVVEDIDRETSQEQLHRLTEFVGFLENY